MKFMLSGKTRIVRGMVNSNASLDGKAVIVTGCNTGIGYETVLDLAARGARIIMACRDFSKAETARVKVGNLSQNKNFEYFEHTT